MRLLTLFMATAAFCVLLVANTQASPTSEPASYPLSTCIVSNETLGEQDDVVVKQYGDREIRFCCEMCVDDFEKDPASFEQKLDAAIIHAQLPGYPLETCVVSGERLGGMGDPVDFVVGNRLVRLCCSSCEKDITENPTTYLATLDSAVVATQVEAYPANVCPISGQKLGSMGEPYDYVFAGRLVRFCCSGCIDTFNERPTAAMATVYGDEGGTTRTQDHAGHDN